jgi:hypothetical protein
MDTILRVLDTRFPGIRVLNGRHPLTQYDHELLEAFTSLDESTRITFSIDVNTWHRAVVKMGLGLACQTLGPDFVASSAAATLRAYLREPDPARRDAMGLRGRGGPLASEPVITKYIHPGGDEHLFVLSGTGPRLGFTANLFGRFENIVLLDDSGAFSARLPSFLQDYERGVAWIVDPVKKRTEGPLPVTTVIERSLGR